MMKAILIFPVLAAFLQGCAQSPSRQEKASVSKASTGKKIGGPCEGCEAIYESPLPFDQLPATDTLPDFDEEGPKLEISGTIYQRDGKTPAPGVVVYVYHTNQEGLYAKKKNEKGWGERHGYIRGWMKTDAAGHYRFFTLRPAAYPARTDPQHIHVTVKEPDRNEYWIDEYVFADDPLLTKDYISKQGNRGGQGSVSLKNENGMLQGVRNIILGLNIPSYPLAKTPVPSSGLAIGSNCPAFDPAHLSGADSGTRACPMCKYGYGQGVMAWLPAGRLEEIKLFAKKMETEMERRGVRKLRVFLICMRDSGQAAGGEAADRRRIAAWSREAGLKRVAVLWAPSAKDPETAGLYRINPKAENTIFLYRNRTIVAKWVNAACTEAFADALLQKL